MIKTLIIYFFVFLFAVFVYMVLGALILEFFLIFLRITRNNKFIIFFVDKFLVKEDLKHPKFEMILWCTLFWPILLLLYIIVIPTIGFTYIIEQMFKNTKGIGEEDDITKDLEEEDK